MKFIVAVSLALLGVSPTPALAHDKAHRIMQASKSGKSAGADITDSTITHFSSKSSETNPKASKSSSPSKASKVRVSLKPTRSPTLNPTYAFTSTIPSMHVTDAPLTVVPATTQPSPSLTPTFSIGRQELAMPSVSPSAGETTAPFSLRNPYTGKFLTIKGDACEDGTGVELWEGGASGQDWKFYEGLLESESCPGMVLDIQGNDDMSMCVQGTALIISRKDLGGRKSQHWEMHADSVIESLRCQDYVVDIQGYGETNGSNVYLWILHNEWNQIWTIDGTSNSTPSSILSVTPSPNPASPSRTLRAFQTKSSKTSKASTPTVSPTLPTTTSSLLGANATAEAECDCTDPTTGNCSSLVQCIADPCDVTSCADNMTCTSSYCGGCHGICSLASFFP